MFFQGVFPISKVADNDNELETCHSITKPGDKVLLHWKDLSPYRSSRRPFQCHQGHPDMAMATACPGVEQRCNASSPFPTACALSLGNLRHKNG
jgi:hypothetical protein